MAKLSRNDEYVVQGMVRDDKSVKQIARAINKPEKTVNDYIQRIGESVLRVEEIRAELARGRQIGDMEIAYGEPQEIHPIDEPITEEERLRQENEALKAQIAMAERANDDKSADKQDQENPFGIQTIKRNVGGRQVAIGAVGSEAASQRVEALTKISRPSTSFGKFVAPIKPKRKS